MSVKIVRKKEYPVSKWSGGDTTEICIMPEGAIYGQRDFSYRISSATIRDRQSTFTSLPDYQRILMVLDGEVTLHHQENGECREVLLKQYQQDAFSGANETESLGICTDFNLIYDPKYKGNIEVVDETTVDTILENQDVWYYFVKSARVTCEMFPEGRQEFIMNQGDSLAICQVTPAVKVCIACEEIQTPIAVKTTIREK